MGKGMIGGEFKECLEKGKIKKFAPAKKLVTKELESAKSDLKAAVDSSDKGDYKWATIQAYYAMFHMSRALIYSKGYREKSHYCLIIALKALFVSERLLDVRFVEAIQTAKALRENADYENEFSEISAEALLEKAKAFLEKTKEILNL